jgi:arylsulfatase
MTARRSTSILRILLILLSAIVIAIVGLGITNQQALGGPGFSTGLEALLQRATAVREAARPEYQRDVLASLPVNPTVGEVFRFDDHMNAARILEEPVRTEAYDAFETVFSYEFDDETELVPASGQMDVQVRDGVLIVEQTGKDYLRNARPIEIVTDDVGEIVIRARARKGKHIRLGWSRKPDSDHPLALSLETPLIADGEFHTYVVNTRGVLRPGLEEGRAIRSLAVKPSDVEGDEVEIDFIRFLSTRSRYMRKARDVLYETIANEMRPVMYMLPRQVLEFATRVPATEPRLSFGTAVVGGDSGVHFTVDVVDRDRTTSLHAQTVDDPGAWHDVSYDLAPWAGREVAVRLGVDGKTGSVGLWSSPIIYGRRHQPFRVVVILEDAERADHLSVYGYDKVTSPFKEELLKDHGAVFLRAYSQQVKTRPSVPSMMTSLLPSVTGVWDFADMLSPEFLTLSEVLRQQGLATASLTQNGNAGPAAGLHQGFDVAIADSASGPPQALLEGDLLWNWLKRHQDRNFLLYLHIADPHGPYDPPPPFDEPYHAIAPGDGPEKPDEWLDAEWVKSPTREGRIALYDGEIRHNDEALRKFFQRLKADGFFDHTLFVFLADHGEHLGEQGVWEHRPPGTVQVTGVPLIMVDTRRIPKPVRIHEPVQLLDVMPTILEFAQVDASGLAMQGDSLVGLLEGRDREFWSNRVIASEEAVTRNGVRTQRSRGLRVHGSLFYRDWHLIASRAFWPQRGYWPESLRLKVFDLANDPQELDPMLRFMPDVYLRYRYTSGLNQLQSISEEARRRWVVAGQERTHEFDPETLEHLKALGYVE